MSKANQAFKQNDEAVSPVIGVILMVAITVVLAAVVFVLVSNLGKGSEKAPNISFSKDETGDKISVISADAGLLLSHFSIKASAAGDCGYNAAVSGDDDLTTAYKPIETATGGCSGAADATLADADLNGGDSFAFCATATLTDVTVQFRHEDSNTLVYETTFTSLLACT
jgi:flagellin-like protein